MYTSVWTFNESLVVTVFANLTPVSSGLRSLNTGRSASLPRHPASISGISSASLAAWCGQSVPEVFFRMNKKLPISRVINLISEESQRLWTSDESEARRRLLASDPSAVLQLDGSFAIVAQDGERVVLARSLDRPLRYFLAKAVDGPVLIVAERIDEIAAELARHGWSDQFHPSYSRMVPAHHVTTLRLVGCPDPNPIHQRFFDPPRGTLPADLDLIGGYYIEAVYGELRRWLAVQKPGAPIGVPFSGGVDSGAVLLCLNQLLLNDGQSA